MNNAFSDSVRQLCAEYSGIITSSVVFTGNESSALNKSITEDVMPLLDFEKPKILVYGIYNGGKSTLVNAICGREAAEVANRPTTYRTDKYDAGKYILVDSPGIDAPIEHEEVADAEINSCHAILFVMSSKGGFEQIKNYTKMWELIQKNLPFIIIINERAEDGDQEKHLIEINNIKRKVIENLIKVSGQRNIENRYSVIVLDAKTAFKGITKGKKSLIESSRISDLTNEIDRLLEKESQKLYLAPLSSLEGKIGESEKILISKTASNNYAIKRETLQQMISRFKGTFPKTLRYSAERHFDEIYQGYLGSVK